MKRGEGSDRQGWMFCCNSHSIVIVVIIYIYIHFLLIHSSFGSCNFEGFMIQLCHEGVLN